MNRPWFQMYSRDWLDSKELRRCSPLARAVLADLMCLAHEGEPYGYLSDRVGPLTIQFMASRCVISSDEFLAAITELKTNHRIELVDGVLHIPRMVRDEDVRIRRASGGSKSIGHPNTHPPKPKEGYPSDHPYTHPSFANGGDHRSDSVSVYSSSSVVTSFPLVAYKNTKTKQDAEIPGSSLPPSDRFEEFWSLYPGKKLRKDLSAGVWCHEVTSENEVKLFSCLRNYSLSYEVAKGTIMNPERWLSQCAADKFEASWPPPPANGNGNRLTKSEQVQQLALERLERNGRL